MLNIYPDARLDRFIINKNILHSFLYKTGQIIEVENPGRTEIWRGM
jgi:hypothetical protein